MLSSSETASWGIQPESWQRPWQLAQCYVSRNSWMLRSKETEHRFGGAHSLGPLDPATIIWTMRDGNVIPLAPPVGHPSSFSPAPLGSPVWPSWGTHALTKALGRTAERWCKCLQQNPGRKKRIWACMLCLSQLWLKSEETWVNATVPRGSLFQTRTAKDTAGACYLQLTLT